MNYPCKHSQVWYWNAHNEISSNVKQTLYRPFSKHTGINRNKTIELSKLITVILYRDNTFVPWPIRWPETPFGNVLLILPIDGGATRKDSFSNLQERGQPTCSNRIKMLSRYSLTTRLRATHTTQDLGRAQNYRPENALHTFKLNHFRAKELLLKPRSGRYNVLKEFRVLTKTA